MTLQTNEKIRRIWEPTYTLVYGNARGNNDSLEAVNDTVTKVSGMSENVSSVSSVIIMV